MEMKNVKPVVDASAATPIQATVPASDVAAGASAAAPVQAPIGWDPYKPMEYVAPENPYDTSIADDEQEVTRVCSPFLVLIPFNPLVLDLALLGFVYSHFNPLVLDLALLALLVRDPY